MARRQVNSATLIMGVTGSGKSSLLYTLAVWLWKNHRKVLRLYTSDGGGYPAKIEEGIELGIIQVFRMLTRDLGDLSLSFETCHRSAQGWWPVRINAATGEVPAGVTMVPPIITRFQPQCPQGHVIGNFPNDTIALQARKCPTCNVMVPSAQIKSVTRVQLPTPGFEKVGAVAYDGLTSMLAWQLREMGHRSGRLELKGEESAIGGKVVSGDLKFGGSTRSHVGFVQTRGEELVHLMMAIPGLVVPPIVTALTHEDVDDRSLSIRGPKISGRAKTDEAPQWVGNCLETAVIPADTGNLFQRVLYLDEFIDGAGVRHLVKNRAAPGSMPAMLINPPFDPRHPETAFTQFNLGVFFDMLAAALARDVAAAKQDPDFADAPGLPTDDVVIDVPNLGTPVAAPLPPAVAAVTPGAEPAAAAQAPPAAPRARATTPKPRAKAGTPPAAAPAVAPATPPVDEKVAAVMELMQQAELPVESAAAEPAPPVVQQDATPAVSTTPTAPAPPAPAPALPPAPPPVVRMGGMAPPAGGRPAVARPPTGAPRVPAPRPRSTT